MLHEEDSGMCRVCNEVTIIDYDSQLCSTCQAWQVCLNAVIAERDEGRAHVAALAKKWLSHSGERRQDCMYCGAGRWIGDGRTSRDIPHFKDCEYAAAIEWRDAQVVEVRIAAELKEMNAEELLALLPKPVQDIASQIQSEILGRDDA